MKSLYIHGKNAQASSNETFLTRNPATGEPLAELEQASVQDVESRSRFSETRFQNMVGNEWHGARANLMRAVMFTRERNDDLPHWKYKIQVSLFKKRWK